MDIEQLVAKAEGRYPFLRNNEYKVVNSGSRGLGYLETYPPGEEGSPKYPRPESLPIDKYGIDIISEDVTPKDLAGDVLSHVDKYGNELGKAMSNSFTEGQVNELAQQYQDYGMTLQEGSPNAYSRALDNGASALIRTSALGQGGQGAVDGLKYFNFSPEQLNILNQANGYVKTGRETRGLYSLRDVLNE